MARFDASGRKVVSIVGVRSSGPSQPARAGMYSCFLGWGCESNFFKSGLMGVACAKVAQKKMTETKVRQWGRT